MSFCVGVQESEALCELSKKGVAECLDRTDDRGQSEFNYFQQTAMFDRVNEKG
jgi:hypothetical protein